MSTRTLPRLPLMQRERADADVADAATTSTDALESVSASDDAIAVAQARRVRRTATIVVSALVLSAFATGVATALARRYGKTHASKR